MLAFTPFPLGLDAHGLGYVFFGWGLMVAVFSVFVAPWVGRRLGTVRALYAAFVLVALDLLWMAGETSSQLALVVGVVAVGAFLGIVNTLLTHTVMWIAPVDRGTTSAAYSFVRFIGGAAAPFLAGKMAERWNDHVPFFVASVSVFVAVGVLAAFRARLAGVDSSLGHRPQGERVGAAPVVTALGD